MVIAKQTQNIHSKIERKTIEQVQKFPCVAQLITEDAACEIKILMIVLVKIVFERNKTFLMSGNINTELQKWMLTVPVKIDPKQDLINLEAFKVMV